MNEQIIISYNGEKKFLLRDCLCLLMHISCTHSLYHSTVVHINFRSKTYLLDKNLVSFLHTGDSKNNSHSNIHEYEFCNNTVGFIYKKSTIVKIPVFRKLHEIPSVPTNLDKLFIYCSGYQKGRPPVENGTIIAPKWNWLTECDIELSGVNFVKSLATTTLPKKYKPTEFAYANMYIGSSTLNKNALTALFVLGVSQFLTRKNHKLPDVFIFRKYNGLKGEIIYKLTRIIFSMFRFLGYKAFFYDGSDEVLSHRMVSSLIERTKRMYIPYFREGFPRVYGESLVWGALPVLASWCKFGSERLPTHFKKISLLKTISVLSSRVVLSDSQMPTVKEELLLSDSELVDRIQSAMVEFRILRCKNVKDEHLAQVLYILLTDDLSWFEEKFATNALIQKH